MRNKEGGREGKRETERTEGRMGEIGREQRRERGKEKAHCYQFICFLINFIADYLRKF